MQPYGPPAYPPPMQYPPPAYYPPYGYPYPFVVAPPPRVPRPRGVPSRRPFLVGSVGQFIASGFAIALGLLMFIRFPDGPGGGSPLTPFTFAGAAAAGGLTVVLLFQAVGFLGLWRNYGSLSGAGAAVFSFIALGVFGFASILLPASTSVECDWGWCFTWVESWGWALFFTAYPMLGSMFIVQGSALLANRHFMGGPGPAVAAGVLYIIAGSFLASIVLAIYGGFFVLAAALLVGGFALIRAPLPSPQATPQPGASPVYPPGPYAPPGASP